MSIIRLMTRFYCGQEELENADNVALNKVLRQRRRTGDWM